MAELRVSDLSLAFPQGASVFNGVSFAIQTGEFAVILGGNASGKTTLLRVLSGLLTPTQGKVAVQSSNAEEKRHRVGLVLQNPEHQMIAATVEEELALGLELQGKPSTLIRQRVDELLLKFSLESIKNSSPELLSGGQKQRVALAAAMSQDVSFLCLDEPDSLLDAPSRRELMIGIDRIRAECGILWATPDPLRMPEADNYFYLHDGRLERSSRRELIALTEESEF